MFPLFLFLLFVPSLLHSLHHRDSHILNLIHRNREDEANSTRFSLFSVENSDGVFSFSSLYSHAFPCPHSPRGEWKESSATLLLPCHHGSVVDTEALEDFTKSNPSVLIPSKCSVIRGLEMDFTAVEIRLNISLRLDGDKSLRVFSDSYGRHSKHSLDRPLIHFSYIRSDEDCEISCNNRNYSIYSTPSCIGEVTSEDEIDVCDMTPKCKWTSFSEKGKVKFTRVPLMRNQKYVMMNGTDEAVTYFSPYIAHTSIKCSFIVDVFLKEGSSLELSYSTFDGNHSSVVQLPETHALYKMKPLSISIGHFFSPVRVEITCHKGSICHIDNLRMKNCEDDSPAVEVCPSSSSLLCSSSSHSKCLSHDRICDLSSDCGSGEDEDDCGDIPSFGLCDFANSSTESFCSDWTSLVEMDGLSFGEANGRKGKSMKFSVDKDAKDIQGRNIIFTSPLLPSTSTKLTDPRSPLYRSCTLRFSYCASAQYLWMDFLWMINGQRSIWDLIEQKNASLATRKCEWKREVIEIPPQGKAYSLSFVIGSTSRESSSSTFELADVSIAESCFIKDSPIIVPSVYNLWPCNETGPLPPSIEQCQKFYNETDETAQLVIDKRGWMTWFAPRSNLYRIELCGASGGSLEDQAGGKAGCVVAVLPLAFRETLEVMIGQEGEKKSSECKECESTPGGGATVIKRKLEHYGISKSILVAGGGGGISWRKKEGMRIDGGILSSNISNEELDLKFGNWQPGDGFTHAFFPRFTYHCNGCESMDSGSNRGGRCPSPTDSIVLGGYGGGGPACGDSPGPGGGYAGGRRNHNETGGTSFVYDLDVLHDVFVGVHTGQGFVRIFPCSLQCSGNRTCVFRSANRGEESKMKCECIKGTDCAALELDDISNFYFIMAAFFCSIAFAFLLYGLNQRRNRSRDRVAFSQKIQEIEMINMDMVDTEHFDCLDNLSKIKIPHMARTNIFMKKLLGKGAFGEVYLAEIREVDQDPYEVAVKTLSLKIDMETQIDFTFETLTLHKLNHPNIVKAMGINTETDPYYLILEYMKGEDLRSFLRLYRSGTLNVTMNMGDFYNIAADVAAGCEYLESNHYVHRDIAARNCLLTTRREGRKVKLADFGMARDIYCVDYYRKGGRAKIPVMWMPPESYMDGEFTNKSDMWSYGVFLWEVFSLGHKPYPGLSNYEVMETVRMGKRLLPPNGTPTPIYSLMLSTWKHDPSSRPTFKHLLTLMQSFATDELETIKRPPPGLVPCGLMQTDDKGGSIETDYPSIMYPHKRREDTDEDSEDDSSLLI